MIVVRVKRTTNETHSATRWTYSGRKLLDKDSHNHSVYMCLKLKKEFCRLLKSQSYATELRRMTNNLADDSKDFQAVMIIRIYDW